MLFQAIENIVILKIERKRISASQDIGTWFALVSVHPEMRIFVLYQGMRKK
jgi:hypothetical protein